MSPPVEHVDKKKKVSPLRGGRGLLCLHEACAVRYTRLSVSPFALMAIVGVVVGAVLGTAKKDAPPALDAVGFKPEDWQNVRNLCGNRRATAACQWPRSTPTVDRGAAQR
jgi:hypothetical protein